MNKNPWHYVDEEVEEPKLFYDEIDIKHTAHINWISGFGTGLVASIVGFAVWFYILSF